MATSVFLEMKVFPSCCLGVLKNVFNESVDIILLTSP